ncbi:MAG: UDP-N-acetylmuramoyl-L-alanine--D-glutamate ligase [Holosporaceae bacterium]|jgi:UDP-N-acetylmuramoylalanine--D-glutamate ligase|nr:UDP-N-acetylmuramoyl-L-alanine--D-glutamate ligase [Holosporaceae bacterium]
MICLDLCRNKNIAVIGFGKTGKVVVDCLMAVGATIYLYDDNGIDDEHYLGMFCDLLNFDWSNLDMVVISPGVSTLWPRRHRAIDFAHRYGVMPMSDIDLFRLHVGYSPTAKTAVSNQKVIGITGTNGKSTTTALVGHVLAVANSKSCIGGNFGIAALSLADDQDFYVLELSSYNLDSSNIFGFDSAVLLNVTPDHLVRHGGMSGYIAAKQKIFANFHAASQAIVGIDDAHCREIYEFLKTLKYPNVIPISGVKVPENGVGWCDGMLVDNRDVIRGTNGDYAKIICGRYDALDGVHNRQNIAASYATCAVNGIDAEQFVPALHSFRGLQHRQELVATFGGIQYINDSKATNAQSVKQAMMRFDNIFWILGGRPKEDGIESLIKYFHKVKHAFLLGEAASDWYNYLEYCGVQAEISGTLDVAVLSAHALAQKEDTAVVLLSPACASFDQFKNFEERGNVFTAIVREICAKSGESTESSLGIVAGSYTT